MPLLPKSFGRHWDGEAWAELCMPIAFSSGKCAFYESAAICGIFLYFKKQKCNHLGMSNDRLISQELRNWGTWTQSLEHFYTTNYNPLSQLRQWCESNHLTILMPSDVTRFTTHVSRRKSLRVSWNVSRGTSLLPQWVIRFLFVPWPLTFNPLSFSIKPN